MNQVRRALSAIKGGRLARAAAPARLVTLIISDVPGDDPGVVASGPTIVSAGSVAAERAAASAILARRGIRPPRSVAALLARTDAAANPSLPIGGEVLIIASPSTALASAASVARANGVVPLILGDAIEGESREVGIVLAGIARSVRERGHPLGSPAMLLSGGETTVTMTGVAGEAARGGRNTELLLSFALASAGRTGIWALAADTDGIDGISDAAGAIVTPSTLARAEAAGLSPRTLLDGHESYRMFDMLGDLIRTGATLTNVNDFRAILVV